MKLSEIKRWLREDDPRRLDELWRLADQARRRHVGDEVHLRGLVEISSHCTRMCAYCGLRAARRTLPRYRMAQDEILQCAELARSLGCGTVVLQAGEDPAMTTTWVTELVQSIKAQLPGMAVTLSLGERAEDELAAWKAAGADRYLLRFETSNRALFDRIHPPQSSHGRVARTGLGYGLQGRDATATHGQDAHATSTGRYDRIEALSTLRRLGYEVGSGVMIGIPGQTCDDLAADIELFAALDLDMIGVGPFIAHPDTPLGQAPAAEPAADQVPATEDMAYRVIALGRLCCPSANIPSTSAIATLNPSQGRELGLMRGANVVMPNFTPARYRKLYEIYPNKACVAESPADCAPCLAGRIAGIGRTVGRGRGDSRARGARASKAIGSGNV